MRRHMWACGKFFWWLFDRLLTLRLAGTDLRRCFSLSLVKGSLVTMFGLYFSVSSEARMSTRGMLYPFRGQWAEGMRSVYDVQPLLMMIQSSSSLRV